MPNLTTPWQISTFTRCDELTDEAFEKHKAALIRALNETAKEFIKQQIQLKTTRIVNKVTEVD